VSVWLLSEDSLRHPGCTETPRRGPEVAGDQQITADNGYYVTFTEVNILD
jgi:hypothetical protein